MNSANALMCSSDLARLSVWKRLSLVVPLARGGMEWLAASADAVKREAERQAKATTEYVAVGTSTNVGAITEKSVTAASKIAGAATEGAGAVAGTADAVKRTAGKAGALVAPALDAIPIGK